MKMILRPASILLLALTLGLAGCDVGESLLVVGQKAPSLKTKKLSDVGGDMSRMTTYRYPDKRMYQLSLDEALAQKKPILLEFATPGHCTVCDKQLQIVKAMLEKYEGQVLFLHMDQYQNPEAFTTYEVHGDPWTFMIDAEGVVQFTQAGRMLYQEMDSIIARTLKGAARG